MLTPAASNSTRLVELIAQIEAAKADVDALHARWSELEAMQRGLQ
jgi:prefoldin subunit 5